MSSVISTAALTEPKRFSFWQDAVCDTFVQLDCKRLSNRPFEGELTFTDLANYRVAVVRSRDHLVERTAQRIRHGREDVLLVSAMFSGTGTFIQDGREAFIGPGDLVCYDSTRPYRLSFDGDFEQLVLHIPREMITQHVARTELFTIRPVYGQSKMGSLVFPFLKQMASVIQHVDATTTQRLTDISLALLTTAFGEMVCADTHQQSCVRTSLVYRARLFIDENLADFDLNTDKVARHLHISERYLQELFHAENSTVSDWIWSRRLEKCKRDLCDPLRTIESISQIAAAAGFSDFGHFSRRFKAAFGQSPREFRVTQRDMQRQSRALLS